MEEDFVMIPGSGTKKIIRDVKKEIETAFLDYSMSVIVSRALPDVRDGLKPVHRRILYTMHERGNDPSHPYRKSADTVGAVLGSYHPHGDASVYDAMVRLAQEMYSGLNSIRCSIVPGRFAIPFSVFGGNNSKERSCFSFIFSDNFIVTYLHFILIYLITAKIPCS